MVSGTVGVIATTLTGAMAIVLETCKCGFAYESISNTKLMMPIRLILGFIALLLVGSSIFASASYVQNNAIKANATQVKDSSQYKQLEAGKALQGDLYNVKKKEIEDLKALQGKQQQEGDNIINSMPKNYIDRKNQQRTDTISQIAKTQDIINSKSNELSGLGLSIQSPIDTSTLKLNADNGYSAMFRSLADTINSSEDYKNNPVKAESLEMWFFIGLGVIFEFVAVLTAYLSQLKNISTHTRIEPIQAPQSQIDPFKYNYRVADITSGDDDKPKRTIGFYSGAAASTGANGDNKVVDTSKPCDTQSIQEIDNQILGRYLDYVYANIKADKSIPGYQTTAKDLGLGVDYVRKLKNHCEHLNILQSDADARKTFIIKPKEDINL